MAHKKKHAAPIPPSNQVKSGPAAPSGQPTAGGQSAAEVASFQEQDPKRRLGDYTGTGEHPYQQPGGLNDANH